MKTAGHLALLLSIFVVTVNCHSNNNGNSNNNNNVWKSYPGFTKQKWNSLSYYLKKLPQKQFFGMKFILNVTGEACQPQWNIPKPPCWKPGWPYPWPGHGGGSKTTTRKPGYTTKPTVPTKPNGSTTACNPTTDAQTTKNPTTAGQTTKNPTTVRQSTNNPTTAGQTTTSTKTSTSTSTSTTTTKAATTANPTTAQVTTVGTPTTPSGGVETTTCQYTVDILDQHYCRDILKAAQGTGFLLPCAKYYSNETVMQFYNECVQFQCKYQRAYRCYGTWMFVENCSHYLQPDESVWGWRADNNCRQDSTPYPAITFTDLPSTVATAAVGKRAAGFNEDDTETDSDVVAEGTESVAFGIKNNWCVPRIYAWWWKKHGGKLPGQNSEDDDDSNGWSGEGDNDDNSGQDDDSNDDNSNGKSNENGGHGNNNSGGKGNSGGNSGSNGGGKGNSGSNNGGGKGNSGNSGNNHGNSRGDRYNGWN